jgi:hypothetical protein
MPAADELFRSTAGGAALLQSSRPEEPAERSAQPRPIVPAPTPGQAQPQIQPQAQHNAQQQQPIRVVPPQSPAPTPSPAPAPTPEPARRSKSAAPRRPSGRERHDEKITVYVSPDELLGLEHARITLRGEYGVAVDRGRIVREAVAALLADLDARGQDSILVKRLSNGA